MPVFCIEGTKRIEERVEAANYRDALKLFKERHGCNPDCVGEREVIGFDEGDGSAILDGDNYTYDGEDGVYLLVEAIDIGGEDTDTFAMIGDDLEADDEEHAKLIAELDKAFTA